MKNLKQWLHRQTSTVWFACVFNLTVLVLMLLILRPGYETNDDISISMISNGAWGVRDMHVICQNYLLGKLYNLFYTAGHGMIPWYVILQYAFVFSALTTVTCVLFRRLKGEQAFLVNGILLL